MQGAGRGAQFEQRTPEASRSAVFGQAVGTPNASGVVLATGQTQTGNDAVLYVYDVGTKKLAAYTVKTQGIEFKGVRLLTYDMQPDELIPRRKLSPGEVKAAWDKAQNAKKKR